VASSPRGTERSSSSSSSSTFVRSPSPLAQKKNQLEELYFQPSSKSVLAAPSDAALCLKARILRSIKAQTCSTGAKFDEEIRDLRDKLWKLKRKHGDVLQSIFALREQTKMVVNGLSVGGGDREVLPKDTKIAEAAYTLVARNVYFKIVATIILLGKKLAHMPSI
jgi:hypothetical protein